MTRKERERGFKRNEGEEKINERDRKTERRRRRDRLKPLSEVSRSLLEAAPMPPLTCALIGLLEPAPTPLAARCLHLERRLKLARSSRRFPSTLIRVQRSSLWSLTRSRRVAFPVKWQRCPLPKRSWPQTSLRKKVTLRACQASQLTGSVVA